MLDGQTTIRSPHAATPVKTGDRWETKIDDPRVSVTMQEEGVELTLFFDPDRAFAGDAELLEIRLSPPVAGQFEPWRLMPQLPLHLQYARASLSHRPDAAKAALRALQRHGAPRRGLKDDFLQQVAQTYTSLVAEGERYPVKAIAKMERKDISTASRWISAARARGFLPNEEQDS